MGRVLERGERYTNEARGGGQISFTVKSPVKYVKFSFMVSLIVDLISGRQFHLHEAVLQLEGGVGLVGHVLHSIVLLDTNKWFNGINMMFVMCLMGN